MSRAAFPTSFAQQRLWFLDQLEPGTAAYNLPRAFRITGPLEVDALRRAFQAVVQRHESLRTVFDSVDGRARQVVSEKGEVEIPLLDLSSLPVGQREAEALCIAREQGNKPFDLTQGPLLRTLLMRINPNQHLLVLVLHHIITDGWSIAILFRELTKCYEAFTKGQAPDLPALPIQYVEYARWQREYLSGAVLSEEVEYWKKKLGGAQTILDLPFDRRRPSLHSWRGATEELVLDRNTVARLKGFAQNEGATLFMACLSAFQAWLWRYTMQNSMLLGSPAAARSQVEIENLIGFFVNTLVFRADFAERLSFRELVRQVRAFSLEAYAHQDVPFEKLVEELVPQRSVNITPLFQAMFVFQNIPKQVFQISGLEMEEIPFDTGIAKFDLSAEVFEDDAKELHWRFDYNIDLFERSTICTFLDHFRNLVNAVLEEPDRPLDQIPLSGAQERNQIVVVVNRTAADYGQLASIQAAFEQQVDRTPDSAAVLFQGKSLSYRELNQRANRLAHHLIGRGVHSGDRVGVSLERSPEMFVALLAVLKAGAVYVPLDPSYPAQWLSFVLEDSEVGEVVTNCTTQIKLPTGPANVIALDVEEEKIRSGSVDNPGLRCSSDQPAYVLYTSGSTGTPKGVEGTHRGCLNRVAWMWRRYPFRAGEVCCQKTNLGFVDSVAEIFGPLLVGIPSVIIPQETLRDPEALLQTLAQEGVTRMVLVPSLLRMLLEHAPQLEARVPQLQLWCCSGEVLPGELVERFRAGFGGATLLNLYGSAEVAADVTWHEVGEADCSAPSVSIGKPISNMQVYILDEQMNPVPIGVRGQIYVGGEGLARGYWRRPELTAERFVANPFTAQGSARLYRTGDLGRFRANGEIEYLGRVDNQVKLRGMRIELGEIEAVLAGHPGVEEAVVGVSGEGDQQRLVAYVRGAKGGVPEGGELRRYVRAKLPEHMVPASYRRVEQWPLLPSGKVDRKAVAAMPALPLGEAEGVAAARTEVERKLVAIWQELLKQESIGIDQNFFELGGHSLLGLQVMARIRSTFDVELPVRSLFEESTIAGLAAEVDKAQRLGLKARPPIQPRRARPAVASAESVLAQLNHLSAPELQSLLQRVLDSK
jgi:amino acid adenylation domain-containing protein